MEQQLYKAAEDGNVPAVRSLLVEGLVASQPCQVAIFLDDNTSLTSIADAIGAATEHVFIVAQPDRVARSTRESFKTYLSQLYYYAARTTFAADRPLLDVDLLLPPHSRPGFLRHCQRIYAPAEVKELFAFTGIEMAGTRSDPPTVLTVAPQPTSASSGLRPVPNVVIGGTFDRLHAGHKILLTLAAFLASKRLIVGVTDDSMTALKKYAELIAPVEERIRTVGDFLELVRPGITYEVVPISNPFGPSITDPDIQMIVVSHETRLGGDAVNKKRLEAGLSQLEVEVTDMISATQDPFQEGDMSVKISSTDLRKWAANHRPQTS